MDHSDDQDLAPDNPVDDSVVPYDHLIPQTFAVLGDSPARVGEKREAFDLLLQP